MFITVHKHPELLIENKLGNVGVVCMYRLIEFGQFFIKAARKKCKIGQMTTLGYISS